MDDLPSLSLSSWGQGRSRRLSNGRGRGRGLHQYSSLSMHDPMDEIPLMSDGVEEGEEGEWEEEENEELLEKSRWAGRRRWQQRIKTQSSLVGWFLDGGWQLLLKNCFTTVVKACSCKPPLESRTVTLGHPDMRRRFPSNQICNQKFNVITFVPIVLFQQFRFFLNLYFLVIALTQFIPALRIGYLYTYWGPLSFVLAVTMLRELYDDFKRYLRDREVNSQKFLKLTTKGPVTISSKDIQVSDIIIIEKNQRIPADIILLRTTEKNGSCFVRTDQLDGETDWKLRVAVPSTQSLDRDQDLFGIQGAVFAERPRKDIYSFIGRFTMTDHGDEMKEDPLSVENTLWANTVLASGTAAGVVIYTGRETRSSMNTSTPRSKVGLVDLEINRLTKILFLATVLLSLVILSLKGFTGIWFIYFIRYIILFSYIIPISLRVNLDMGKIVYSWMIQRDRAIPDTVVRSSTIPEELGRVEYLLTDKTGTLTQNEMVFRKLHMGSVSYSQDSMSEVASVIRQAFQPDTEQKQPPSLTSSTPSSRPRRSQKEQLLECVRAIAICHNVTPVVEEGEEQEEDGKRSGVKVDEETVIFQRDEAPRSRISYQASSPDEIALVKWTESVGLTLVDRDLVSMTIEGAGGHRVRYETLQLFPFTSERKRMGIIVRDKTTGEITFYMKGADAVMTGIVQYSDWLEEECGNMAREGLRTLVVGKKVLTEEQYSSFETRYKQARLSVSDREAQVSAVVATLEESLQLLCVTGVEDQLQLDVRPTLELLRNAGIKVWMLTGDKLETAASIALSSRLVSRAQTIFTFKQVTTRSEAHSELNSLRRKSDSALVIAGSSLELCLKHYEQEFVELACQCPAVVCCRCSPTHKAQVVKLLQEHSKRPVCAVGDGGNDVSMIQAANVGLGIVGKEGKQASLAADFSITQFRHISRLLVWHGRNSYKRSANLSQFVIHRGLIISVMQAVFSAVFYFAAVALYEGILMVGYATIYTMAPVFSLVLDEDVSADIALMYPELYRDLMKGRSLSLKTFFVWVLISLYQGSVIMLLGFLLFEGQFIHVVAITFTSLIVNELLVVALTIRTWHGLMLLAELFSVVVYVVSLLVLKDYFDGSFLLSPEFAWKTLLIIVASCLPLFLGKFLRHCCAPPSYAKLLKENSMFRNCCKYVC